MASRRWFIGVAGTAVVALFAGVTVTRAAAVQADLTRPSSTHNWVGDSVDQRADNHSWTDPRNWQPKGVPHDGDAVNIVSPQSGRCDIHVDHVPTGVILANFLLSTSIKPGCKASISGGSITIGATFLWTGGTVDTPITVGDGVGVLIGDEGAVVAERLKQPLVMLGGGLTLRQAHLHLLDGGRLTLSGDTNLSVTGDSQVIGSSCCGDLPRIVNRGKMSLFGSLLALDSVAFDQRGEVDLDAGSSLVTTHGSLRSRDGAQYVGPGRFTMSNGTSAIFVRRQALSGGVHLEFGNDGTEGATLNGVAQLTGDGTLDWTGGTLAALLHLDPGVTLHAYKAGTGPGRRILSGQSPHDDEPWHYVVCSGPVVVDEGAGFTMTQHALLGISSGGSLTLAPGTRIRGTSSGAGDTIRSDAVVSVPADRGGAGPVVLDQVSYALEGGGTFIAPSSELIVSGAIRGFLGQTGLTGGGTFSVASPMDVVSLFTFADGSLMRLQPGGALDGSAVYTGDGSFDWSGGQLKGNDVAFALNDLTVGGSGTKSIADDDGGGTSFVQVVNPVTFTAGTKRRPSLLDMNGNGFQSFLACTVHRNVELRDGDFVSSVGALVFQAGSHGSIVTDPDVKLFSSGPLSVASGTLVSKGSMMLNGGDVDIRDGAAVRLPDPRHPLKLQGGSLTGQGVVDGDLVNSAGVFDPLESGADHPLTVTGSYTQSAGGGLVLDLAADSEPIIFGAAVTLAGTVSYHDMVGYSPAFGDVRTVLTSGTSLTWTPGCEETTGARSVHGHWAAEVDGSDLVATFTRHPSGTC